VIGRSAELYDYDEMRASGVATVFARDVVAPVIVLGSRQDPTIVVADDATLRQRRGGGGAVLLGPGDLWIDFWIPCNDERFRGDVRAGAHLVGSWWRDALRAVRDGEFVVHDGPAGPALACFAATGDGEVERTITTTQCEKVVGLTQWRVREGSLISTVLHAHSTSALSSMLRGGTEFHHDSLDSLELIGREVELTSAVTSAAGPWSVGSAHSLP
jgi:lipoate-protein ligase A